MVVILPWVGSGLWIVSRDPDAVTICCSFVPANWPSIACVIDEEGWMVSEYMNIEDVVAIVSYCRPRGPQSLGYTFAACLLMWGQDARC